MHFFFYNWNGMLWSFFLNFELEPSLKGLCLFTFFPGGLLDDMVFISEAHNYGEAGVKYKELEEEHEGFQH
jgi:hypothetical protein